MVAYLGWMIGGVGDYRVCESWFSVYGCLPKGGGSLDCDVEVVYLVSLFQLRTYNTPQLTVGVYCVEV